MLLLLSPRRVLHVLWSVREAEVAEVAEVTEMAVSRDPHNGWLTAHSSPQQCIFGSRAHQTGLAASKYKKTQLTNSSLGKSSFDMHAFPSVMPVPATYPVLRLVVARESAMDTQLGQKHP